ncbi:MAG: holo-ACP synthase [candidate division WOR-3 bacterium]
MVKGIGVDVVNLRRFERVLIKTPRIKNRLFTQREIENSYSLWNLAGKFAAKEAVLKSVGLGLSNGLCWHDVEIIGNFNSPPKVILSPKAKEIIPNVEFFLSISHERDFVVAVCLAVLSNT